ncbi:MAG TPA: vWA domain-containing protein [Tepidisphaeraceae bacterium]|jgi:hypothetical protein|nr:vWA domain-containing protein [Tepidisphaeraceae bacterium]
MPDAFPLTFSSPLWMTIALVAGAGAAVVVFLRRLALPPGGLWLCGAGMALLCAAAGRPMLLRPAPREAAVMVDLSPSTRTADYRTRARLHKRIESLLGKTPYRIYYFASRVTSEAPGGDVLGDLPAEETIFRPPAGAAGVVLFSDGRFDLPAIAPPTYVVLDANLESPIDAAVTSLEIRGKELAASVTNTGNPRRLVFGGTLDSSPATAPSGSYVLTRPIDPRASIVSTRLGPQDAWPENDQLVARPPPAEKNERWWVGPSAPPGDWRQVSAGQLPADAAGYLAPSVIVLENVAAADLTSLQQQRLQQYVRDLGGGLVILGGDRAFAAGAYPGSVLETLSPLASTPPWPTTHWILLADGSGSMAGMQDGFSLWHRAADAIVKLIARLPPDDVLSVGSFSDSLAWWSTGKSVRQTAAMQLPPPGVGPHGPTNLEETLLEIARTSDADLPKQLLLLTDADARINDPVGLEAALKAKKIRLHLLAIADGSAVPILRPIIRDTGGTLVKQFDPAKWTQAVQTLMRAGAPKLLVVAPLPLHYAADLSTLPARDPAPWNRTWLKQSAALLAAGNDAGKQVAAGAGWNVGEGRVFAFGFDPGAEAAEVIASAAARPPRDPRYRVTWDCGSRLRVAVDATDDGGYLNGKTVRLDLSADADASGGLTSGSIPQVGPGRYELTASAPRSPVFASVQVNGRLVDRIAIAGRYAPEFDAIGNDHDAMNRLARRTGGQVIPPRQTWAIDFRWPRRELPLGSPLATCGALLIMAGLIWWKLVWAM